LFAVCSMMMLSITSYINSIISLYGDLKRQLCARGSAGFAHTPASF
jgi:hypothetical protein